MTDDAGLLGTHTCLPSEDVIYMYFKRTTIAAVHLLPGILGFEGSP